MTDARYKWLLEDASSRELLCRDGVEVGFVEPWGFYGGKPIVWANAVDGPEEDQWSSALRMTRAEAKRDALAVARHLWDGVPLPRRARL